MQQLNSYLCVVTIAGSDPSGGAGIQADIKAISATGCYAASIITALTAQNTRGVQAIQAVPPEFITQQIDSVFSDLNVAAVKIGMLHNAEVINVVAEAIEKYKPKNIILDPVMIAKNGSELLDLATVDFLQEKLFPHVNLITPNLFEAEKLLRVRISDEAVMEMAAMKLGERFKINVLIKGGHLDTSQSSDVLYQFQNKQCHWFHAARIDTQNTHGTGCTLASAIASYLAQQYPLLEAVSKAKEYLTQAIQSGSHFKLGGGQGPVDHFFNLENSLRRQ